ncbi:hypothetical protein DEX24_14660 [Kurthia sibirica]|uniref:Uncharacterized protein n=2 Tax=Kurthia sibirica TaxID=202750 RepID=A0A2U3AI96_9BACL|nr:hypothetical protein DEX24_14660 [Kurthia sibirica]
MEENINELLIKEKKEFNINSSNVKLLKVRELYDLNDDVIAFYYNIIEDEILKGYVLASVDPNLDSILEYGQLIGEKDTHYGEVLLSNNNLNAYYLGYQAIFFDTDVNSLNIQLEKKKNSIINKIEEEDKEYAEQIESLDLGLNEDVVIKNTKDLQLFAIDPNGMSTLNWTKIIGAVA